MSTPARPLRIPRPPGKNMALRRRAFQLFIRGRPIAFIARDLHVSRQWVYHILWPPPRISRLAERLARDRDPEGRLRCEQCGIELYDRRKVRMNRLAWCWHQRGNNTMEPDTFDEVERIAAVCRSCELFNHSSPREKER